MGKEHWAEINKLEEKIKEQQEIINKLKRDNENLHGAHKRHKRRESEVFDAIGDDAKNVVAQYEEMESARKQMEDDALQLAFLQAEKQRMAIAYDHAKANTDKYREEVSKLKAKIKDLE